MEYRDITLAYGEDILSDFIPTSPGIVKVIHTPAIKPGFKDLDRALLEKLENPVDCKPLKDLVEEHHRGSGKKLFLLADDHTRPNVHTKILLPILLRYLREECGVPKEEIRFLVASGTHRPPTPRELEHKIYGPDLYREYREQILIHNDSENLAEIGLSPQNTPITINREAYNASLILPVTDSEYHYFAGVAGTVKQLFPGIAGRRTTNTNHPQMFDRELGFKPACRLGNTDENPVISDMKAMAVRVSEEIPVFCVDAIFDEGQITYVNAGHIISMHEQARVELEPRRGIEVDQPADLVIVTVGKLGINLYQSGKGIHAAWNAVKKPGGTILLTAPCEDGVGSGGYEETMRAVVGMDLDEALEWVLENKCSVETFRIGNQKPVDLLRILKTIGEGRVKILSEMDPEELREVYRLEPLPGAEDPQKALRRFLEGYLAENPDALIYVMQDAGLYVVPR